MKIIGIEGSSLTASVAIFEDGILIGEYTTNHKKTHSVTLLPMLEELKKMCELDLATVDAIAVSAGPGSFTGLRIAASAAKGIALALNKPIVPVPTVDGLAYNMWGHDRLVCPIMDARRGQTYTGLYEFVSDGEGYAMNVIVGQCAVAIEEIVEKINEIGKPVTFLGDGVPVFKEKIAEICKVEVGYAPAFANRQRAAVVATLGQIYFEEGKVQTATEHAPDYLRLSQAERERMEQSGANS